MEDSSVLGCRAVSDEYFLSCGRVVVATFQRTGNGLFSDTVSHHRRLESSRSFSLTILYT